MEKPSAKSTWAELSTERTNASTRGLHRLSIREGLERIQHEDEGVARCVAAERDAIARAVELIAGKLAAGGRLFYLGAGSSGRLAALDAAECPPTFCTDPEQVQAILAGGPAAMLRAVEGAEDSGAAAIGELRSRGASPADVVFGIAASGATAFVREGLEWAKEQGIATVFLACVPRAEIDDHADVSIRVVTGPEVLAGSTRMKAGTATKLVLNAISTLVMVQLGKVYENLMVDLAAGSNAKLWNRALRILASLTGLEGKPAEDLLRRAGGRVKLAVLMQRRGLDAQSASEALERAGGFLDQALEESPARNP